VLGNNMSVLSRDAGGDYYRPLAPGRYTVLVSKEGYKTFAVNLTVPADGSGAQRHFVLAREGSSGSGEVTYSLKTPVSSSSSSSSGGGSSEGGGGGSGSLPWKDKGQGGAHEGSLDYDVTATRARDRLLMLLSGAGVVYGLWLTHSRLQRRTHQRRA